MPKPLDKLGIVQGNELGIKFLFTKDDSERDVLDFLIFEENEFPSVHKRINYIGEFLNLENFEFSLMYERPEQ